MQSVYNPEFFAGPASEFANYVKHFPKDWILPNYQGVTAEALDYFRPLVAGEPDIVYNADGLPKTVKPYNLR
jgi:6-phosphofructokinase 1